MDLQQAKIVLDKINSLYKSMAADEDSIAKIEVDLMLSYLRQLYDSFIDPTNEAPPKAKKQKTKRSKTITPELEIVEPKEVSVKPTPKPKYKKPRIIEIPDSLKDLEKEAEERAQNKPTPPPPPPKETPKPKAKIGPKEPTPSPPPKATSNPKLESLFEHKTATELSEKLSERPINDLTKALAINDRLLYMNELFGKSMDALNVALGHLNTFENMEAAKPYLLKLAQQHDWLDKERQDTAKDFIKLVRRKY